MWTMTWGATHSNIRAVSPVVFPMEACYASCWKPNEPNEREKGCPARHAGIDGAEASGRARTAARLRYRPAYRADQRRSAPRKSRHAISRSAETRAGGFCHLGVGRL